MNRRLVLSSLVLSAALASRAAHATELDGLGSFADSLASDATNASNFAMAFRRSGPSGSIQLDVQSRSSSGTAACTQRFTLPSGWRDISNPALSDDGWLFVVADTAASGSPNYQLFAQQRGSGADVCTGWSASWGSAIAIPSGFHIASAPAALHVPGGATYVFLVEISDTTGEGFVLWAKAASGALSWHSLPDTNDLFIPQSAPAVAYFGSKVYVFNTESNFIDYNSASIDGSGNLTFASSWSWRPFSFTVTSGGTNYTAETSTAATASANGSYGYVAVRELYTGNYYYQRFNVSGQFDASWQSITAPTITVLTTRTRPALGPQSSSGDLTLVFNRVDPPYTILGHTYYPQDVYEANLASGTWGAWSSYGL